MKKPQTHAVLLALVGGYLLYIAYHLLENLQAGVNDMPQAAAIAAIAVFTLAGAAVMLYALHIYRAAKKEDTAEEKDDSAPKD